MISVSAGCAVRLQKIVQDTYNEHFDENPGAIMHAKVILSKCDTTGECVQICPEVFKFQPGHKKAAVVVDPIPKIHEPSCRKAAKACPRDAIVIDEDYAGV